VAFLSRGANMSRVLTSEEVVIAELRALFNRRSSEGWHLTLDVITRTMPTDYYAGVVGIIGVHGGAFANLHACAQGTTIIEVTGQRRLPHEPAPRSYAPLALGLGMDYYIYYALHFPRNLDAFHRAGSSVMINVSHFVDFVDSCLFALKDRPHVTQHQAICT
jgi:hypothetical protein